MHKQFLKYLTLTLIIVVDSLLNAQTIELWKSEPRNGIFLTQYPSLRFTSTPSSGNFFVVNVNQATRYQLMDGYGGSLTDASCWLFRNRLSVSKRIEILNKLFGPDGINLSLLRQPLGASDFNWEAWSFDDTPSNQDDFNLNYFALWREDAYIRPVLDEALSVNRGRIRLFATPWSPPAWMKTNRHLNGNIGGVLRSDCYNVYADYFVRYLKEYEQKGTPVYAITVQNEPLYAPSYPGMLMSENEQATFIKNFLGPKLQSNNLSTKIIAYDHNFDTRGIQYATLILSDAAANRYIDGVGFHTYASPNHGAMGTLYNTFRKDIWITEAGSGTWIGDNTGQFQDQMMHLIRAPRNWAKGVVFWNIALDQNSGPKLANVDPSNVNRGFVTIRSDTIDSVTYEMSYYSMGHSSKFVDPGAYRIDSTNAQDNVETVAYLNTDNTIALVISNRNNARRSIKITWNGLEATFDMEATSAASLKWRVA